MSPSFLISVIATAWVHDLDHADCGRFDELCHHCASSDLVLDESALDWSHDTIHRLVAPIEEIIDAAVEDYLDTDRDDRLATIDAYRSRLRTTARHVVDHALMHRRAIEPDFAG